MEDYAVNSGTVNACVDFKARKMLNKLFELIRIFNKLPLFYKFLYLMKFWSVFADFVKYSFFSIIRSGKVKTKVKVI